MILSLQTSKPQEIADVLLSGRVAVIPTDTLYGLSCSVRFPSAMDSIRELKGRKTENFIVLVGSLEQAREIVHIDAASEKILNLNWPGPFSFILPNQTGHGTTALRMPNFPALQAVLALSGPIVSTSCNPTGKEPAKTIPECQAYFELPLYVDNGPSVSQSPSALFDLTSTPYKLLRKGPLPVRES